MKKIIILFVIWRLSLFLIAAISESILPTFGARFPYYQERLIDTHLPHFIWSFGNFDGVHYLGIAATLYSAHYTQAFFPLYPITIKIFSLFFSLFFNEKASLLISGLFVSNVAFLSAILIFYKLIKNIFSEKAALWSSAFLIFSPTSFYFGSVYTESLFLLLTISAYYLIEKNKIFVASILGVLASATRLVGVFLASTLKFSIGVIIYLLITVPFFLFEKNKIPGYSLFELIIRIILVNVSFLAIAIPLTKNRKLLLPIILIPFGLLIYSLYLKLQFDNPYYFITAQSVFGNERSTSSTILLPQVIFRYVKILLSTNGLPMLIAAFELFSTLFAFMILLLSFTEKKIKREWITFSLLSITIPTMSGTFSSMPRYILIAFPIYIYLSLIESKVVRIIILVISFILLSIMTALFSQGYWVA